MSRKEVWLARHANNVSPAARLLLAYYIEHSWFEERYKPANSTMGRGVSYWSNARIAEELGKGMSERTIIRASNELEAAGYISKVAGYREYAEGGRSSNFVTVLLEVIEAKQSNGSTPVKPRPDKLAVIPKEHRQNGSYPPDKLAVIPTPLVTDWQEGHRQNGSYPPDKLAEPNKSNKKRSNKEESGAAANGSHGPAPAGGQLPGYVHQQLEGQTDILTDLEPSDREHLTALAAVGESAAISEQSAPRSDSRTVSAAPAGDTPAVDTSRYKRMSKDELDQTAVELLNSLAGLPAEQQRSSGDFTRLLAVIALLHGERTAAVLESQTVPRQCVSTGKALAWLAEVARQTPGYIASRAAA